MKILLFLLLGFLPIMANAQDGYTVNVSIANTDSNTIYWGYYYGGDANLVKVDSAKTTSEPFAKTFKKEKKIAGGMYILWFKDKSTQLDLVVNNGDNFTLNFDKLNPLKTVVYTHSDENTAYTACQREIQKYNLPLEIAKKNLQGANNHADSIKCLQAYSTQLDNIETTDKQFAKLYPYSIASIYLQLKDNYRKKSMDTYWDDFPFTDERIVLTPIMDKMLTHLFKTLPEDANTINPIVNSLLDKASDNKNIFKYSLWWLSGKLEHKSNAELELVYLNILEKYYLSGKATWLDSNTIFPFKDAAKNIRKIMVGDIAPDITLLDINEKQQILSEFCKKQKYTLLIMWSPTCPHCKKQLPIIDSEMTVLVKTKDIKIFAIQNDNDDVDWRNFITAKNLINTHWLHLHSTEITPPYRAQYNTYTNPRMFLLDSNRKVLNKYITSENLMKAMEILH